MRIRVGFIVALLFAPLLPTDENDQIEKEETYKDEIENGQEEHRGARKSEQRSEQTHKSLSATASKNRNNLCINNCAASGELIVISPKMSGYQSSFGRLPCIIARLIFGAAPASRSSASRIRSTVVVLTSRGSISDDGILNFVRLRRVPATLVLAGGEMARWSRFSRRLRPPVLAVAILAVQVRLTRAVDEIQVYNAEIADVGQFTIQHHFNYAFSGRTEPDFPGGLVPNHTLNATPEFAWGITKWFELGLYFPWAIDGDNRFLSNGTKLRTLFVTPDAEKKKFFYGINFEYDFTTPPFSQTRFAMEVRPIIGWRNHGLEFIINPIVDIGFGSNGGVDFLPAARLARKLNKDVAVGLEYYTDLGRPGSLLPLQQQSHQLFAVVDFKVGKIDVDFGVGLGLTEGSDRWVAKTILFYAFPVEKKPDETEAKQDDNGEMKKPLNMKLSPRQKSPGAAVGDPFFDVR